MSDKLSPQRRGDAEIVLTKEQRQRIEHIKAYDAGVTGSFKLQMGYVFLAGRELNLLKDGLPHGQFEKVAELEFPEIKERSRQHYMKFERGLLASLPQSGKNATVALLTDSPVDVDGEITDAAKEVVFKAVHKMAVGKTLTEMYRGLGIIRQPKAMGGARPNAAAVQEWLRAQHPDLVGTKFDELPKELQKAFLKQHQRGLKLGEKEAVEWFALGELGQRMARACDEKWYTNIQGKEPLTVLLGIEQAAHDLYKNIQEFRKKAQANKGGKK